MQNVVKQKPFPLFKRNCLHDFTSTSEIKSLTVWIFCVDMLFSCNEIHSIKTLKCILHM